MLSVSLSDVRLGPSAGDADYLARVAAEITGLRTREVLSGITKRLKSLNCQADTSYGSPLRGRYTSVGMLERGAAWGCSAHGQVSCHLARARNIPAIVVKTLLKTWIEQENAGDGYAKGHVFVELLMDGRPALWEHENDVLIPDYDPSLTEITVDGAVYCIYEKGDPDTIILSHHGAQWEKETKRLFPSPQPWRG